MDVLSDFRQVGNSILSQKRESVRTLSKNVYVSKRKIGPVGSYLEESFVESLLLSAGFEVVYPESMSIYEQLFVYHNAERIVFCEGSALHALLFLDLTCKDVFYISRRADLKWIFDGQLLSQSCRSFKAISCVNRNISISKNEWEDVVSLNVAKLIDEFKRLSLIPDDIHCSGIDEAEVRLNCFNSVSGNLLGVLKKKFIGY
jgi:capsular polysaccharide biosynthesis protein